MTKKDFKDQRIIIPYEDHLKEIARQFREDSTKREVVLWNYLKRKKMLGYNFHRQKPLDRYIVDFFCNELMLAIEVDGDSHDYKEEEDLIRQRKLEAIDIRFLRFDDWRVRNDIQEVVREIREWILKFKTFKW